MTTAEPAAPATGQVSGGRAASRAFWIAFVVYVVVAAALLSGGLLTALVASVPAVRDAVAGGSEWFAEGLFAAAAVARAGGTTILDFAVSCLSFGLGLLIVGMRPANWTARLVAVGAVGTAAAFNLESHTLFFAFAQHGAPAAFTNALHMGLHAVSGAAYLHAFLSFPDGRLGARWQRVTVGTVWLLAAVETAGAALNLQYGVGPIASVFHRMLLAVAELGAYATDADSVAMLTSGDALFYVTFFGLFVPVVGLIAQARRYRTAASAEARQQSRVLAWTLTGAFGLGVVFFVATVVVGLRSADPLEFFHQIEGALFRGFAPLFTIVPVALLVGIVRYRLWAVDDVVRNLLTYVTLTITVATTYVVVVVGAGLLLRPMGTGLASDLQLVLSTLVVAALFMPLYRRVRRVIDRRFRAWVPDAATSIGDLADRLDGRLDAPAIRREVLSTVEALYAPRHLSLWSADDDPDET